MDNMFSLLIGYTVNTDQGRTIDAMSADELAQDFPDVLEEASAAIDAIYLGKKSEDIVTAHWMLPLLSGRGTLAARQ